MGFIKELLSNQISVVVLLATVIILILFFILFVVYLTRSNRKMCRAMNASLSEAQERHFTKAAELLADKLSTYTDQVLVEKVNDVYTKLVAQDLLPAVNLAAVRITELSEAVTAKQESGMRELATMMADLLAEKTRDYLFAEKQIITMLNENVTAFSGELDRITQNVSQLTMLQDAIHEQSKTTFSNVSNASNLLSSKISELDVIMHSTVNSVVQIQQLVNDNSETVRLLVDSTAQVQSSVGQSLELLSNNNQKTADIIHDAVYSMQQNSELAAKTLVSEFGTVVTGLTQNITSVLMELHDISGKIQATSMEFSGAIHTVTDGFNSHLGDTLNDINNIISKSVSAEYKKIVMGAEEYSNTFTSSINSLNVDLDNHISSLQTLTEQLTHNITTTKSGFDYASQSFQSSLETSISSALNQMDRSLADILQRLVEVTVNIQDAADALPRAVSAIKKEG